MLGFSVAPAKPQGSKKACACLDRIFCKRGTYAKYKAPKAANQELPSDRCICMIAGTGCLNQLQGSTRLYDLLQLRDPLWNSKFRQILAIYLQSRDMNGIGKNNIVFEIVTFHLRKKMNIGRSWKKESGVLSLGILYLAFSVYCANEVHVTRTSIGPRTSFWSHGVVGLVMSSYYYHDTDIDSSENSAVAMGFGLTYSALAVCKLTKRMEEPTSPACIAFCVTATAITGGMQEAAAFKTGKDWTAVSVQNEATEGALVFFCGPYVTDYTEGHSGMGTQLRLLQRPALSNESTWVDQGFPEQALKWECFLQAVPLACLCNMVPGSALKSAKRTQFLSLKAF
ncbi:hypothetical protein Anapl_09395 [Anas platyrhynchos]|uniref:Uncharacterized protein n=1 Tax=Anas platyrhynchos TaxID=8839 RepID=R0JYB9_ANAPL|nr:hypothetical protein Anapl_09395 [Anas platyrhynchos]